ncbi:trypsin-like serine protease [Devosia sp. FKR38]|uniref:trypsin-like serine protease n=1 Tax=Devosia sp. FKR38 TaxID=2562312 RepID=UPI0014858034|nr:trypsin-like serine protease [Devosia sp. FKR38]
MPSQTPKGPGTTSNIVAALLATTLLSLAASGPAQAVIILDSTWADQGGAVGAEGDGFGAARALAMEPQFCAIMSFFDGEQIGGSGTWIGNDQDGTAYVLTAAHNFGDGDDPATWTYYTRAGTEFTGKAVHIHPNYDANSEETPGYDIAIVELNGPVEDCDTPPLLYGGSDELGQLATMVGFGSRGIGSVGQDDKYYTSEDAAAARNIIDVVEDPDPDGKAGNQLLVDFDSEDGSTNVFPDGDPLPVDEYEGVLGSGDSGGSLWIETDEGWAIVGVNDWGDDAIYGSTGGFGRISPQYDWVKSIFDAHFTNE